MKKFIVKLSDNYADEFDVEAFVLVTEKELEEGKKITDGILEKFFEKQAVPISQDAFSQAPSYRKRFWDGTKYVDLTYEDYVENPRKYNASFVPVIYKLYFGTNEQLHFNSAEQYWQSITITEITDTEYECISRVLGTSYGLCPYFFPLEQ